MERKKIRLYNFFFVENLLNMLVAPCMSNIYIHILIEATNDRKSEQIRTLRKWNWVMCLSSFFLSHSLFLTFRCSCVSQWIWLAVFFFSLSFALNSFNTVVLIENLHHLCINGHRSYDVDKSILLFFTFACIHFWFVCMLIALSFHW